jgi:hypothetical protein
MKKSTVVMLGAGIGAIVAGAVRDFLLPKIPGINPGTTGEKIAGYILLGATGAAGAYLAGKFGGK